MTTNTPLGSTPEHLTALGIERHTLAAAVRAKCLDCASSWHEVRLCESSTCPLWPWRMGRNPWARDRTLTPEQKAAALANLKARPQP